MAVQAALAETHVLSQTKAALEEAGVDLGALTAAATRSGSARASGGSLKRSKTVMLVKNLPPKTDAAELSKAFERFGPWLWARVRAAERSEPRRDALTSPPRGRHWLACLLFDAVTPPNQHAGVPAPEAWRGARARSRRHGC